jgi:hypothetical protein
MEKKPGKVSTTDTAATKSITILEQVCAGDKETCDALAYMFLDPRKIDTPMEEAVRKAEEAEEKEDMAGARMWYEVAGGLALYAGDVKKVVKYYGEAQRVTGQKYMILNNPEKAVAKAQEYYKKALDSQSKLA